MATRAGDTGHGVQPAPVRNELIGNFANESEAIRASALVNFLMQEEQRAHDTELDQDRALAIQSYFGLPYGDEVEGRSGVVTRDVSEVVDYQVVGILGTVISSGKVVEFETGDDDDDTAEEPEGGKPAPPKPDYGRQATKAIQYQFMRKQNGYRILHDSLKAGLMEKTGIVKSYAQPQKPGRQTVDVPSVWIDVGEDGPTLEGRSIVEAIGIDEGWEPGVASVMQRVTVEVPRPPLFRDEAVPNEQFLIAPDALDCDTAVYVGHKPPKTLSELVEMGFDRAQLETLWGGLPDSTIVSDARDANRSQKERTMDARPGAVRKVYLNEEYPLWDWDDDGIAERLCVHRINGTILRKADGSLSITEVDSQPFSGWSPFPMQHRFVGQSSADKVMDIQRIRTVLLRQGLDSQYQANAPRVTVSVDGITDDTIDDLLTVRPGALIRHKGSLAPQPFAVPDTSANSFQAMEMMTGERESRTGVTRHNQGLNPDTLNKTASGMAMLQASGQQIELYIARNYAEFLARVFLKRYVLMRTFGQPFSMKIDGKATVIDPRQWPEEIDVTITVGLGTGNKDQKLTLRMSLLEIQQAAIQGGMRGVTEEQIFHNVSALIEDASLGVPTDYWLDPATLPPAEPKQDPEIAKAQMQQATDQAKIAAAAQKDQQEAALKAQQQQYQAAIDERKADQDMMLKSEKAQLDSQLARDRATEEAVLAREKFEFEKGLAIERFVFDQEMQRNSLAAADDDGISQNRPGGALDE